MKVLVISHSAPSDSAGSAGEKTHNYYLKVFSNQSDMVVRLISVCDSKNAPKLDLDDYGIENDILIENHNGFTEKLRKTIRFINFTLNPKDKYSNFVSHERESFYKKTLGRLLKEGYKPDVIILEFTQCILLIDLVKKYYPDIPIIGSSHDVSYKGSYRILQYEQNPIKRFFRKRQYNNLKQKEIEAISKCDLVLTQNRNDIEIFKKEETLKCQRFDTISPYFDSYADIVRQPKRHTLIFYGSMSRNENYLSVIWFIENVFQRLDDSYQLIIIGGNPPECITNYKSDRIIVTGFVALENVKKYFAECMCMVVPLVLGSGIKVKILEAFSGGVPVITNSIGIEGIYASDKKQYIHCESPEEYAEIFQQIDDGKIDLESISSNSKSYIHNEFSLVRSKEKYIGFLHELTNNRGIKRK